MTILQNELERIIMSDPVLRATVAPMFARREANWRYFGPRGALGQRPATVYFWTVERVDGKFVSGVYKYIKTRKEWGRTDSRTHAKRKDAKARAWKLWKESQPIPAANKQEAE